MTGASVEYYSACYCGEGHFNDWVQTRETIRAFDLEAIVPGRGDALTGSKMVRKALDNTKDLSNLPTHRLHAWRVYLFSINTMFSDIKMGNINIRALNLIASEKKNPELVRKYLGEKDQAVYLIRLDQHIAASWSDVNKEEVVRAIKLILAGGS